MIQITKELAEALVKNWVNWDNRCCSYCGCETITNSGWVRVPETEHMPECIVTRAKLLLELEWGIKS